jgi:hypothetical protein
MERSLLFEHVILIFSEAVLHKTHKIREVTT